MEKQAFKYYAFISYNHKDSKEARKLHRRLESYKIPNAIRKETSHELPKKISPIFLDSDEANSGDDLKDVMSNNLRDSQSLIVVCSPNSAKSKYVNHEVAEFLSTNNGRKIIPYIIEGSPSSKDQESNCYPPSLDQEITGASIQELGKQKALVKVVAAILDINFDKLWDRHKRRERQTRLIWTIVATIIIGLFMGLLINRNIKITNERNKALTAKAYVNYKEGTRLINSGKSNTGIAYLTRSLEDINFEPSIRKLNSVLVQESFLILDTVMANRQTDFGINNLSGFNDGYRFYSASGAYSLYCKNGKFSIERKKDSRLIGSFDLHHQGKIIPSFGFTQDEKIMFLAELIYNDVNQDDLSRLISGSSQFRLRVCSVDPFCVIKDIQMKGALDDVKISPMGNHIVITYRKENELETTIEAVPLKQPYEKWECNILGNPQKLLFSPNGIYISTVLSQDINDPDEIKIYDIFNAGNKNYTIPLFDKLKYYCYSNDGRRLAVLTNNKELNIFDIPTGNLAFNPLLLADTLNVISMEFDISDTKINIKTRQNVYSYLLQKTPFKLGESKLAQAVVEKLCCNTKKEIIATSHNVYGDKSYISFRGGKIGPLKYNNKINTLIFSPKEDYLAVGTGDLLDESGSGDVYLYRLEQSKDSLNGNAIVLKQIYQSKLDYPVSKIVFNRNENYFIVYTTITNKQAKEVYCFSIGEKENITNKKIFCNGNVEVVKFINRDNLAIGTNEREIELWNITENKKEREVNTNYFPVDIGIDNNQRIVVASTFNHSSGEIRYFNTNGVSEWNHPLALKFGIQKLIVADNNAIIISEENVISIIDLKTKKRIVNDIKVKGTIKNAIIVNNSLKVLSYYFDQAQTFNLKESEQFSHNQGRQSFIQTFDIETGEELEVPIIINDDIINIEDYKDKLLYYSSNFLFSAPLVSKNFDLDIKDFVKIADAIAGCRINNLGVIEITDNSLVNLPINSKLKQWFSSSLVERRLFPMDSSLIKDRIKSLSNQGKSEVLQVLDIYPSYLQAQKEFWFSEAIGIAKENFISNCNAKSVNQHTRATMDWENNFDINKTNAIYSYPKARLFADFYTDLMVRQHPNSISALKERANFCQHTSRLNEYNNYMDRIEDILIK